MSLDKSYRFDVSATSDRWFNWQQPACPFFLGPCFTSTGNRFRNNFKFPFFTSFLYFRPIDGAERKITEASWLLRIDEGKICGQYLIDLLGSNSYQQRFKNTYSSIEKSLLNHGGNVLDFSCDSSNLLASYQEFVELFHDFYMLGSITEPVQWAAESILKEISGNKDYFENIPGVNEWDESRKLAALLATKNPQYINEIESRISDCIDHFIELSKETSVVDTNDIYNSVSQLYIDDKSFSDKINTLTCDFSWKNNNYYECTLLSSKQVLSEIVDIISSRDSYEHISNPLRKSIIKNKEHQITTNTDHDEIIKHISPYHAFVSRVGDEFGSGLADRRKKSMLQILAKFEKYAASIAEKTSIPIEYIKMCMPEEIESVLKHSKEMEQRLKLRYQGFVLHESPFPIMEAEITALADSSDGAVVPSRAYSTYSEGLMLKEFFQEMDSRYAITVDDTNESIVGDVAYKPKGVDWVRGRAKVVRIPAESKIELDEILVASSTTPDFMHLIRNCKAIVTDQSGMTTHAALTSRELNIPCIVGSRNASHVIKTGNFIVLNLISGEIIIETDPSDIINEFDV